LTVTFYLYCISTFTIIPTFLLITSFSPSPTHSLSFQLEIILGNTSTCRYNFFIHYFIHFLLPIPCTTFNTGNIYSIHTYIHLFHSLCLSLLSILPIFFHDSTLTLRIYLFLYLSDEIVNIYNSSLLDLKIEQKPIDKNKHETQDLHFRL